ncbi:MAG TPA: VWA domain-containing protein [Tepidisphaeraceae bacterium]|nr:VWA domain-containing protein [Tepidisphaeraceae bacterium]
MFNVPTDILTQHSAFIVQHPLAFVFPLRLEYFTWPRALALFAVLALPIILLGLRSLNGLGPMRKWVAISLRLAVLLLFILILGGARWQRTNRDLELIVLRDVSESTAQVKQFPGKTLQESQDQWFRALSDDKNGKPKDDRVGVISFHDQAVIDAMPSVRPALDARPIRDVGAGTNVAAAIQLSLATLSKDAMHRLLLVSDGNATAGDHEAAINAAIAAGVQVDVAPLNYNVQNEVVVERLNAPAMKRENEPFTLDVVLKSTNPSDVVGRLTVLHSGQPMDMDPYTEGLQATRMIKVKGNPGGPTPTVERIRVPALSGTATIHEFKAIFEADGAAAGAVANATSGAATTQQGVAGIPASANPGQGGAQAGAGAGAAPGAAGRGDTLLANNVAEAFTFIKGKGRVLYVDNVESNRGDMLRQALVSEQINVEHVTVDSFPNTLVELQNYDAIILSNVPRGAGGISDDQQKMLATYVHDLGGGLLMVGGPDTFGAGGWQGSKLEEILPVNMDIPAQRQLPKGALVLVMHSCEMPDGNYWGEQCALKAVETLSERDEIGVISYAWNGPGGGGSNWDFPLQIKGDGSRVQAAIKRMQLGDMPSFDDTLDLALNGRNGVGGLIRSDSRQKHVIIISDGDPNPPAPSVIDAYKKNKVTISTVSVYPHTGDPDGLPPTMKDIAKQTNGRAYGPVNQNPNQLPQIFIKEATVVRRSLIHEPKDGIPIKQNPGTSDIMKGMEGVSLPALRGMVLTSRKSNPQIEIPLTAGAANDPIMAHWQTGLGKAAIFTGDAHNKWAAAWVGSPMFSKFWSQMVRGVQRPPMSTDFEVSTTQDGQTGRISVEALNKENGFLNFLNMRTTVIGPDLKPREVRLTQTGPGTYSGTFDAKQAGNYVTITNYTGPKGDRGQIPSGMAVNSSPELRDLRSNESFLREIAQRTGGRVFAAFNVDPKELFTREGLKITASPLPIWDILLPILLGLIIVDVATRRIAWDWASTKKMMAAAAARMQVYTQPRKPEAAAATLDALRRVRDDVAEQRFKPAAADEATAAASRPDRSAKFEARGVEGDISRLVGGASDKPVPPPPKDARPKGAPTDAGAGGHTSSLLEAKRRARQQIEEKERGE